MYDRDVKAENKETLDRLVQAIERLAEIHAKDRKGEDNGNKELLDWLKKNNGNKELLDWLKKNNGNKELLDWLKKNNDGRATREVPTSDDRADVLRTTRGRISAAGGGTGIDELDASVSRINSMFRAMQGDMGGFQKSLVSSLKWGERASELAKAFVKAPAEEFSQAEVSLKEAKKMLLNRVTTEKGGSEGMAEYFKQLSPDAERIEFHRKWMPYDEAVKQATQEKEEELLKRVRAEPRKRNENNGLAVPPPPGAEAANSVTGSQLAKIVTTTLIGARMATVGTIEYNRRFQNFDGVLATDYAMFEQGNLLRDMRHAKKIAPSVQKLLESETNFRDTMAPLKELGSNFYNTALSGANRGIDILMTPISKLAKVINNSSNRMKGLWDETVEGAATGSTIGSILGGVIGFAMGGVKGAVRGAIVGGAWGVGIGAAEGFGTELLTERRRKELDRIIGDPDDKSKKGMIGTFANDLLSRPLAPPRKFIP